MIPSAQTGLGNAMRLPLRLIPKGAVVPILSGPNKGLRWVVGSGVHGYWVGRYEKRKQAELLNYVKPDSVVYDIGANVGFYTLMFARHALEVYAFEPLPRNLAYLRRHVEMNGCDNVSILPLAVSNENGEARFDDSSHPAMGHLEETGRLAVETAMVDSLLATGRVQPPPDLIKIDIEGAGLFAVRGAMKTLKRFKPVVFLAIDHDRDLEALDLLRGLGYSITEFEPREIVAVG